MNVSSLVRRLRKNLKDNSPAILTGVGIAGCITTGALAGRAGYKAGYDMAKYDAYATHDSSVGFEVDDDRKSRAKLVAKRTWKLYLPSAVTGVGTIASIAAVNRIGTNRATVLAAAYTIADKAFVDYQNKVVETIGEKKESAIQDAVAQDRVTATGDRSSLIVVENSDILCYDKYTDRLFNSSMEKLKKAQNDTNYEILHNMYVSLSEFYERVGLPKTQLSDEIGWSSDNLLELNFTSCLTPDGRTALAYDFHVEPIRKYWRANG